MRKSKRFGRGQGPRGKPTVAPCPWDMGAEGPANRDRLRDEDRPFVDPVSGETINPNGIRGVRRETWVGRYHREGKLNARQFVIALELHAASEGRMREDPLAALRIDRQMMVADPQAAAFDARRHFHRLWAMIAPDYRLVVERVVIQDLPIWRHTSSAAHDRYIGMLASALDDLGDKLDAIR